MTNATIIKAVMVLAAEAELGALFLNAKEGVHLRQMLWCKPGWTKNILNLTFLDYFQCPKVRYI